MLPELTSPFFRASKLASLTDLDKPISSACIIDNTRWIFGEVEIGTVATLNAFKQLEDTYEQYEMEFYKKWHNKGILNGARKWWELNKILSSSENGNKEITHVTLDIMGREIPEILIFLNSTFEVFPLISVLDILFFS